LKNVEQFGFILIGGTTDWDNQAGKAVAGLDQLHRIEFSQPVKFVFSSSSASHTFFVLNDGTSIFSIGMEQDIVLFCLLFILYR
jgi:hypothetical protein